MISELAIVIPCYKGKYLKTTLDSLVAQTNKNFTVYIGDDNSKDNIEEIIANYVSKINITYHKFQNNLGSQSLVQQWERCIFLSKEEPWIWILPDDDYIEINCVEVFLNKCYSFDTNLFRFNTNVVDENGRLIESDCVNPPFETGIQFIADKLLGNRRSSVAEYIFSRNIFLKKRITEFPTAWCSDDATWLNFSEKKGICTLQDAFVNVRISNESISGNTGKYDQLKIDACLAYLKFLKKDHFPELTAEFTKKNTSFNTVTKRWFLIQLANSTIKFSLIEKMKLFKKISEVWNGLDKFKMIYFILKRY